MKDPILINKYIPDHKDPGLKKVVKYTDILTHHVTLKDIEKEPQIGIFYTFMIECPHCGERGYIMEAAMIAQMDPARKVLCRRCKKPINIREGQALFFAGKEPNAPKE